MIRNFLFSLTLLSVLGALPASALTNYGDYTAITVKYLQVSEQALTAGDSEPLFGAPTLAGDGLDFNPTFAASASGAAGIDSTDGELLMTVEAKPTNIIENISLSEAGEYDLNGGFTSNDAYAAVTATIWIDIVEIDGVSVAAISPDPFHMVFTEAGDWLLSTDGGGIPKTAVGTWSGSLDIDITQILIDEGASFVDGATKVNVTLDNHLTAVSDTGTSAFIAKKNVQGFTITANVIPEPSTAALLGLGLVALGAANRRR